MPGTEKSSLPVVISGAGIAGLTTAIALARIGFTVTVLERRIASSEEGAGIQIGPNGTRILAGLGITPHLEGKVARPEAIRVMDGVTGKTLTRLPLGRDIELRHGAPYWVTHRADLHAALSAAAATLPAITLRYGTEVTGAESGGGRVTVELATGEKLHASLLVVAEGLWSKLRTRLMGAPPLTFTGKSAVRAVLPRGAVPDGLSLADTTLWLRPAAHVVHYPVRAGEDFAIVAIFGDRDLGETWAGTVEADAVTARTTDFPAPLRELLSKPALWRQWSLLRLAGDGPWVKERIVLVGDTAHPPLPFLAQGGAMALEDAAFLAALLAGAPDHAIPARLATFEAIRRPRTTRVMAASARNGDVYHLEGFLRRARNAVLAATPPHLLMRSYDWLYGWTVEDALKTARIPAATERAP